MDALSSAATAGAGRRASAEGKAATDKRQESAKRQYLSVRSLRSVKVLTHGRHCRFKELRPLKKKIFIVFFTNISFL
jgi:hypothetical protein